MFKQSKPLILTMLLLIGLSAAVAFFQPAAAAAFDIKKGIVGNLGSAQCQATGDCTLCDFIDLFVVLQKVILSIFAGLALIMLIWGGQGMIMAAGNQEKFTAGRKLITSTLFGVLIILAAYFLTSVLYIIIATPKGQTPQPVLSESWWKNTLGCKTPSDPEYCKEKNNEGSFCNYKVADGLCQKGACVATGNNDCVQKLPGAVCKNIDTCGGYITGTDITEKRKACDANPGSCLTGLCAGGSEVVCCK